MGQLCTSGEEAEVTRGERTVLAALATGHTIAQVSAATHVSGRQVHRQVRSACHELHVSTRTEAVVEARLRAII